MTSLEKILAFSNVSKYLRKREITYLKKRLNLNNSDIKRNSGIQAEYEFYIMVFLREHVMSILPFNEELTKLTDTPSPDVLIVFNNGKKILVEIKSTDKNANKISTARIQRQMTFAKLLGLPLYYLFMFESKWVLLTARQVLFRSGKIDPIKHTRFSKLNTMFRVNMVAVKQNVEIKIMYSKKHRYKGGAKYPVYGAPIFMKVSYLDKVIQFPVVRKLRPLTLFISALTAFMGDERVDSTSVNTTELVWRTNDLLTVLDFHIFLYIVFHTINPKTGIHLTAHSFLTDLIENGINSKNYVNLEEFVMRPITVLKDYGIPIVGFKTYE